MIQLSQVRIQHYLYSSDCVDSAPDLFSRYSQFKQFFFHRSSPIYFAEAGSQTHLESPNDLYQKNCRFHLNSLALNTPGFAFFRCGEFWTVSTVWNANNI